MARERRPRLAQHARGPLRLERHEVPHQRAHRTSTPRAGKARRDARAKGLAPVASADGTALGLACRCRAGLLAVGPSLLTRKRRAPAPAVSPAPGPPLPCFASRAFEGIFEWW